MAGVYGCLSSFSFLTLCVIVVMIRITAWPLCHFASCAPLSGTLPRHMLYSDLCLVPPLCRSPSLPSGPPPAGYDHNYVLFGLGPDAATKTKGGMASEQ